MRKLLPSAALVFMLLLPASSAASSSSRPVALVTAETANEVLAVSLGKYGGHILRRVHLVDPVMVAAAPHSPAVVVSPRGSVTLLAWHTLLPITVFHAFHRPEVAAIAPDGRLAYVTDDASGELSVIDLGRRRIVDRVFVGAHVHHLAISPSGAHVWVALGETARTIVRLDASDPRKPRVVGRFHPRSTAHDLRFEPDGKMVWVTSAANPDVRLYSSAGQPLEGADGGRAPQHVAFSGRYALIASGYGSSLAELCWRRPSCSHRTVQVPYGSFNLATYGGFVVTTSLLTGQVTELRLDDLHRLWTEKVAPAARYVAISVWPR